uniref:Putative ovule protein n=1 Tax=Solanum chacoense TaxID=4108 RepID=A0A0V0H9G7_SOLCH
MLQYISNFCTISQSLEWVRVPHRSENGLMVCLYGFRQCSPCGLACHRLGNGLVLCLCGLGQSSS